MKKKYTIINVEEHGLDISKKWAQLCIDFILDTLTKIIALKLDKNNRLLQFGDSNFSKTFDAIGIYDVYFHRSKFGGGANTNGFVHKEMKKTLRAIATNQRHFDPPLRAIAHIWADEKNYDLISIDIYNLHKNLLDEPPNKFWAEFKDRIQRLIECYFDQLSQGFIVFGEHCCDFVL